MSRTARALMVVLIGIIIASLIIAPAALGSTLKVSGTLVLPTDAAAPSASPVAAAPSASPVAAAPSASAVAAAPSASAVAVVTVIDATNTTDAGNIIGQQRIDGVGDGPITFAVPYDSAAVVADHAYAIFATVVDGTSTWQNAKGVPVITGGPTEAVRIPIVPQTAGSTVITGRLPLPTEATLSSSAVSIAALIKQETGTLVSRQVLPTLSDDPPSYSVSFDPTLIDPAATYVIVGAVVDGATVWESTAGVPVIVNGAATGQADVPLVQTTTSIPVVTPAPTPPPSATPPATPTPPPSATPTASTSSAPTDAPTASPTPEPTATPTPEPTASPTPTPTPTASPAPTASPTPAPTASPPPSPSPTASPVPSASLAPPSGVLTGTLDYPESYQLSADAVAVVALVEGKGRVTSSPILATEIIDPAGQSPVAFELTYDPEEIDADGVYTLQAGIFDSSEAWVTPKGVPVITNGAQADLAVTLSYRPDAAKGEVTGSVTGVGISLGQGATAVSVLIDVDTGLSLGVDLTYPEDVPAPFAIPFSVSDLEEGGTYVVQAELTNGSQEYANAAGVPVITDGHPISGVQVVVSEVATPSPSPSEPAPSPSPAPEEDSGLGSGNLLLPLLVIGLLVLLGGLLLARSKDDEPPTPPAGTAATAGTAAAAGTVVAAEAEAEAEAEGAEAPPAAPPEPPASPGSDQA